MNRELSQTELARIQLSRRELFQRVGGGIGGMALASLLARDLGAAGQPRHFPATHFPARARSAISIHLVGAPSQLDLFDYKPELVKRDGRLVPESLIKGQRFAFLRGQPRLSGTPYRFERHGRSGMELSELLPHLSTVADDIALVKTLRTDQFNHAPAQLFMQTGFERFGRPSLGSWVNFGLGSESSDLPGFVVLVTGKTAGAGNSLWGSGFLPTVYQGVQFRSQGDPVLFLSNPEGIEKSHRRRLIGDIEKLNRVQLADVGDPEIATRISQYELAYRMQSAVPDLMDLSKEPPSVHELYGTKPGEESFANHCLLARRLVERGVRFVQIYDSGWDHHGEISKHLPRKCQQIDQGCAALIKDLKRRGLLNETLVTWGAEFGRTPMRQESGSSPGRDHHKEAFSVWLAGGGIRGGTVYGETDELGYFPVGDSMHVNDLHATILHCLGMDHTKLTFKYQGRLFRLTDVGGVVAEELLA